MSSQDKALLWFAGLGLVLGLMMPVRCSADDCAVLLPKCQSALSACDGLRKAEDAQATVLRDSVKRYKKLASDPGLDVPLVVWTSLAGAVGGSVGAASVNGSVAAGGIVGTAIGAFIGLLGR